MPEKVATLIFLPLIILIVFGIPVVLIIAKGNKKDNSSDKSG